MRQHIDILGYLWLVYAGLLLLAALAVVFFVAGTGLLTGDRETIIITSGVGIIVGLFLGVFALIAFAAGYGLLKRLAWARILVIVLSILSLFSFPLGTALGIYGLWVLMQDEAKMTFA